jgi:hypothetical protein
MKKILFSVAALLILSASYAQNNVGVGSASPHTSAMLDVSSTTKGMLVPRMTTVQRTAIASPATGLMVYDITTNSFWFYNGSSWAAVASNGGLSFPYEQTVNTNVAAFRINNQGTGPALHGASSNQLGIALNASATGDFGWGLNAYTDKSGAVSVRSVAELGQAFYGENAGPTNNNTLMYLFNKGLGKTHHLQLANNASTASNLYIAGNHLGKQVEIWQTNAANTAAAVSIVNSGTGAALYGSSNDGNGITGASGTGSAVRGDATSGTGVLGYSNSGIGVNAGTISGTGIYTNSISGLALNVNGNLKIAGGNTSPGAGKVLTSDASGNATWQAATVPPKIAFRAYGVSSFETSGTANNEIPNNEFKKIEFNTESYDISGHFATTGNAASTPSTSRFTVPVRGVYHFDAVVKTDDNLAFNHKYQRLRYRLSRNGNVSTAAENELYPDAVDGTSISLSMDVFLEVGDQFWIEFEHFNLSLTAIDLRTEGQFAFFNGHLVFAQ